MRLLIEEGNFKKFQLNISALKEREVVSVEQSRNVKVSFIHSFIHSFVFIFAPCTAVVATGTDNAF